MGTNFSKYLKCTRSNKNQLTNSIPSLIDEEPKEEISFNLKNQIPNEIMKNNGEKKDEILNKMESKYDKRSLKNDATEGDKQNGEENENRSLKKHEKNFVDPDQFEQNEEKKMNPVFENDDQGEKNNEYGKDNMHVESNKETVDKQIRNKRNESDKDKEKETEPKLNQEEEKKIENGQGIKMIPGLIGKEAEKERSQDEIPDGMTMEEINNNLNKGIIYDKLPPEPSSEIRLFLSSTFKDSQMERNHIIEHIYGPLREFCKTQYDMDLILIDLRWGITDEATNRQLSTEICLNEIDKCREYSIGPYFVSMLSHRYGTQFLKPSIHEKTFTLIKQSIDMKSLLELCYILDENSEKNKMYKLKNKDELEKQNVNEEQLNLLMKNIRDTVHQLFSTNKISKQERDDYFISVTEQEIRHFLLNEKHKCNANKKWIVFFREIIGINDRNNDEMKNVEDFIDDDDNCVKALRNFVDGTVAHANKKISEVRWEDINNSLKSQGYTDQIKNYLFNHFGKHFEVTTKRLIEQNISDLKLKRVNLLNTEILHHALLCNKLLIYANVRKDIIHQIKDYLDDYSNIKPLIITGASGSGKSTILAYTVKHLKKDNNVFVYRFMGTSRESSNMRSIMLSIIKQMENIYKRSNKTTLNTNKDDDQEADQNLLETESEKEEFETTKIKERFKHILENISSEYENERLIIVLDSIDQLSKADYSLEWFIYDLPKNVKMIYSVIPEYGGILDKLEMTQKNFLEISKLDKNEAKMVLEQSLNKIDRKLDGSSIDTNKKTQWSFVNEIVSNTSQIYPLHIRIIFDIVSKWPSWYKVENEFKSCISTKDTIKYLFKGLETFHGQILFSRCVFYLTLFEYNGISEAELEDILSIDDELLNSVFVYHHPPLRRFQIALWLKIKYDLKDYITNKETDGVSVISWFHRSFIEASNEYYQDMFNVGDVKDKLLMNVVDYFTEKYNEIRSNGSKGVKKEFEYKKKLKRFEEISQNLYAAYRYTKGQKIKSIKTSNNQNIYNKRKLNELVNVISMMRDNLNKVELLKKHVYFNYEFMHAKCELKELNFIFEMDPTVNKLSRLFSNEKDIHELNEINEIYKHVYPKLVRQEPNLLNIEILSRLSDNKFCHVEEFQKSSGLKMISRRFVEKETVRDLFFGDYPFKINTFYEQFNGDLLFIESTNNRVKTTRIDVIDSGTSKSIGSIPFNKEASHIQIVLNNENTNELNKLTDLNGFIYFSNGDSLLNYSFLNNSFNLINSFDTEIEGLLILNSTHLLVFLRYCLFLLNFQNINDHGKLLTEPTFRENNQIQFIESTIPKETVFNSQYLDGVDSIYVIVGFVGFKGSNSIKIYKFSNEHNLMLLCPSYSIKWSFYGFIGLHNEKRRESILIDESFMIDNMTSNKLKGFRIKFALQHEGITKINEVNNKGEFNVVDEINENIFGIDDDERYEDKDYMGRTHKAEVELDSFKNDKIIFKLRGMAGHSWSIYLYKIGSYETLLN